MPRARSTLPELPRESIRLITYASLDLYLRKFAAGELGLVLLIGRQGTGKSESVKRAVSSAVRPEDAVLYVEGHMQPYGLYRCLWERRGQPAVLDDLDRLYADVHCVRLLKALCNTQRTKTLTWLTQAAFDDGIPATFTTTSNVILIANEWRTINANVRALEDRAIILHFDPSNDEVHRRVGEWFEDREVYDFIAGAMPQIGAVSMRHYCKASQLRNAGMSDWRESLLQMVHADHRMAVLASLLRDQSSSSERERIDRFVGITGCSRATYFRLKGRLLDKGSGRRT